VISSNRLQEIIFKANGQSDPDWLTVARAGQEETVMVMEIYIAPLQERLNNKTMIEHNDTMIITIIIIIFSF